MQNIRCSIEQYGKNKIYYFNDHEITKNSQYLKELIGIENPLIVQNGNLGSLIINSNNDKILFENMLANQVEKTLYNLGILSNYNHNKEHELIIEFEKGHAKGIFQYIDIMDTNSNYYYNFDFVSKAHADGDVMGLLSVFLPDNCKISWNNFTAKKGVYLESNDYSLNGYLSGDSYNHVSSELSKDFKSGSDYLIIKINTDDFNKIFSKSLLIEELCSNGNLFYTVHSYYENSYNCFSSLKLLTLELGLEIDIINYFFDEQLALGEIAHSLALINTRDITIDENLVLFLSMVLSISFDMGSKCLENLVERFTSLFDNSYILTDENHLEAFNCPDTNTTLL